MRGSCGLALTEIGYDNTPPVLLTTQSTMQITIDLPEDIEQYLIREATNANVSPQTLILQVLRHLTQKPQETTSQWSDIILSHQGFPDFPAFESYRDELLLPGEPELF